MNEVELANLALSHLRVPNIQSMSEDSAEAVNVSQQYDSTRRAVLQRYDWSFATTYANLPLLEESSEDPRYEHMYQLPTDCLRVLRATTTAGGRKIDYKLISGNRLLTNETEIVIEYIFDAEDVNTFDDLFISSFSHLLAYNLAMPLTGDSDLRNNEYALYNNSIPAAASMNTNEMPRHKNPRNRYVDARRGGLPRRY